jgi:hypothetical protein
MMSVLRQIELKAEIPQCEDLEVSTHRRFEPSRVCRRLFRLSHAAMAGCSVTA